jgi:hypothetical protein
VPLDQLITTKNVLDLHTVLATDSTFYGDLFPHVIMANLQPQFTVSLRDRVDYLRFVR